MSTSESPKSLADDILRGAEAIGAFIGLEARQTFHCLQAGNLPATKEGKIWVSTKSRLRQFCEWSRFEPEAKPAPVVRARRTRAARSGAPRSRCTSEPNSTVTDHGT